MNKLNNDNKKIAGKLIGSLVLLIAIILVSKNYQDYQNSEKIRKTCEQMKIARHEFERAIMPNRGLLETTKSPRMKLINNGIDCDQIK